MAREPRADEAARPNLGAFAALQTAGADGLVADEAKRRAFFGEDLA